jgi:hypothetical protein
VDNEPEGRLGQQRYVSTELTHFLGRALPSNEDRYALLLKILREGRLTHPPHNLNFSGNLSVNPNARVSSNEMYSPQVVCFCDIPVGDLGIHVQKYGPFGIAFPKGWLVEQGANPVYYVANPSRIHSPFTSDLMTEVMRDPMTFDYAKVRASIDQTIERGAAFDRAVPEWHRMVDLLRNLLMQTRASPGVPLEAQKLHDLTLFMEFQVFSFIKFFDPGLDDSHHENFYMEREWRVVGNVQFNLTGISRVLLPKEFGHRLRKDIAEYDGQVDFLS